MEVPVKARAECVDGLGGEATHVIVHSATKRVTHLVVKEAQPPQTERVVPLRLVENATAESVRLRCSRQELSKMQTFFRTEVMSIEPSGYGEPLPGAGSIYDSPQFKKVRSKNIPKESVVDGHVWVKVKDGKAGRVSKLMVDPTNGAITHLLLHKGRVWASRQVSVPIAEVDRIGAKAIHLRMSRESFDALPTIPDQGK